jgi:hypothetical protein
LTSARLFFITKTWTWRIRADSSLFFGPQKPVCGGVQPLARAEKGGGAVAERKGSRARGGAQSGPVAKLKALREETASLLQEKDSLTHHICPSLSLAWTVRVGHLECELFEVRLKVSKVKRMTELIQVKIYQDKSYSLSDISDDAERDLESNFLKLKFMKLALNKDAEAAEESGLKITQSELASVKSLYREIAKQIHPDINPNISEKEADLFKMASDAYKVFDLWALEAITAALGRASETEKKMSNSELASETSRLRQINRELREAINSIKQSYPYNKIEILSNPAALEAEKNSLIKQTEHEKERLTFYEARLSSLAGGRNGGQIH